MEKHLPYMCMRAEVMKGFGKRETLRVWACMVDPSCGRLRAAQDFSASGKTKGSRVRVGEEECIW